MNKEEIVNFIGDLIFPIDPAVFCGYGTTYQNNATKALNSNEPTSFLEIEERYISNFIATHDVYELFDILLEFLVNRPIEYMNNLATRRNEDWDYYVILVISRIGNIEPNFAIPKLKGILVNYNDKRKEIINILTLISCRKSYELIIEIHNQYQNLTEEELGMIKEFEEEFKINFD